MKVKILNRVENIVAKDEIVYKKEFLNLSQCFQVSIAAKTSLSILWKGLFRHFSLQSIQRYSKNFTMQYRIVYTEFKQKNKELKRDNKYA